MIDAQELEEIQARDAAMPDLDGAPQFYHDRRTLLGMLQESQQNVRALMAANEQITKERNEARHRNWLLKKHAYHSVGCASNRAFELAACDCGMAQIQGFLV